MVSSFGKIKYTARQKTYRFMIKSYFKINNQRANITEGYALKKKSKKKSRDAEIVIIKILLIVQP